MRQLASSLTIIAVAVMGLARIAEARPSVRLVVDGECPSAEQLRTTLSTWVEVSEVGGDWTVSVTGGASGAELAIRDPSGELALSRRLVSRDCGARADAFAVMIHGHFVELQLLALPERPAPPAPPASNVTPPAEPVLRLAPAPVALDRSPVQLAALAISGGAGAAGTARTVAGFGQLEATWLRSRWLVAATIGADLPATIGAPSERVELWRAVARGGLGHRFDLGRVWLQPALGAGVTAWRVDPIDLPGASSHWRVQPIGTATATLGVPVARWLALRIDAGGTLFLIRDRYLVDPQGVVARSPRAAVALGLGLELGFFR